MRLIFTLLFVLIAVTSKAQRTPSDPKIRMLKKFYTAYISEVSNSNYKAEHNLQLLRKRYCTLSCLNQYKKLVEETDSDPLINAQDSDKKFLKSLTIKKSLKKADWYRISYADGIILNIINLKVITQNGEPKIESIDLKVIM
ncbi:hypothetical protein LJ707_17375 [Mucilaginibacter sp. UR6-1]|uniref:hypothetical protein n=1 Tax=Mucilaginibacter sp. UR6-1 TaxID=1435643 RepID=UPI001E299FD8|nr:hypothetical protein [Mucilaginibacter sp. UR6-1]MCC8410717.1 hypothetical protein [Mucilaginibacter sp. UR6-1]